VTSQSERFDFAVVGGGVVGLATAMTLSQRRPGSSIVLVEKEAGWASHQSGRNSGVIHAGVYYAPGSLKATLSRAGSSSIVAFAAEHGIAHEVCGKLIVATHAGELARLDALYGRARSNGLAVTRIGPQEAAEIEPHVRCVGAIWSSTTGIVDYRQVCATYAELAEANGVDLRLGVKVTGVRTTRTEQIIETTAGAIRSGFLINCGGLHADRLASAAGADLDARIVPFRGEYYELVPDRRYLVNHLIYPVPDPNFPFLGVHFTRMIGGEIHAGPNAVLALHREGYRNHDVSLRDLVETLSYRGFWRLAARHWREGAAEIVRSLSKQKFTESLQALVPEITKDDLVPSAAGVRAQAIRPDGGMVDDFLLIDQPRALHVANAPSPAATASLEIARTVVDRVVSRSTERCPGR
jgi:(S)-2-hydroxyglutarate dehydrogenase